MANRTRLTSSRGRRLVLDQRVGRLDAELGLAGARRRPAPQPGQLLAQQVAPALLGDGRHAVALRLGQHVRRIAAVVGVDRAPRPPPRWSWRPRRGTSGRGSRRRARVPVRVRRVDRWSASQATPSTSRWLVGSSSSSRSGSATSSWASASRRRSPPDIGPTTASRPPTSGASMPPSSPSRTSRTRASPAQTCSGSVPSTAVRTVAPGSRVSTWVSMPQVSAAEVGHAALVDLLAAGQHLQQGGLAATVAADDADAAAGVDAEARRRRGRGWCRGRGSPARRRRGWPRRFSCSRVGGGARCSRRVPFRPGCVARPARAVRRGRRHRRRLRPGHRAAGRRAGAAPRRHRSRRRLAGRGRPRPARSRA